MPRSTTAATLQEAKERAYSDLWSYFDDMLLDLIDTGATDEATAFARQQRDTVEALLLVASHP